MIDRRILLASLASLFGLAAFRWLRATPAQAAGIVGNLQQESGPGLDPTIVGDSGDAFGIAQWNDRRDALHGWAQSGGMDPAALQTQLDFISHELDTTEGRAAAALRGAQTPEEAARAFLGFERPQGFSWADPTGSHGYQNRVANALRLYGGGTMPQPMSSMPAPGPAAGGGQMAGGLLGVPPAPALKQGWLGGLLGVQPTQDQGLLGGFLNPQSNADTMGWLQAAAMELAPGEPLMSRDNLASMQVANVATAGMPGLDALGIQAAALQGVAQDYLTEGSPWHALLGVRRRSHRR